MQANVEDGRQYYYRHRDRDREDHDRMFYVSGTAVFSTFFCFMLLVLLIILAVLVTRTNELLKHLVLQNVSAQQQLGLRHATGM